VAPFPIFIYLSDSSIGCLLTLFYSSLFEGEFGPDIIFQLQRAMSWIPRELQPANEAEVIDKEALFREFVQFKQKMISDALNSMYKVSHTSKTASSATVDDCVTATTKGTAKSDNERWFLEELCKSRLANSTVENRLQYLLDTYCVPNMALPVDLKHIKAACEASLRQKRIDFKQKVRKLYRKKLGEKLPDSLAAFQEQVMGAVCASLGEEHPEDPISAFSRLSPQTVRFFKDILTTSVPPEQASDFDFLALLTEEGNDFEGLNEEAGEPDSENEQQKDEQTPKKKRNRNRNELEGDDEEDEGTARKKSKGGR
jgi:hypothetical protein